MAREFINDVKSYAYDRGDFLKMMMINNLKTKKDVLYKFIILLK